MTPQDCVPFARPKSVDLQNSVQEALTAGGLCVFLVATYGEGDPTDNAREFVAWLKQQPAGSDLLARLQFAVFGLGNRQYEHFNSQGGWQRRSPLARRRVGNPIPPPPPSPPWRVGKLFDERLAALGGNRLLPIGLGDDDGTMEDDYASWKDRLWPALAAAAGGSAAAASTAASTAANAEAEAPTLAWSVVQVPAPTGGVVPAAGVNASAADVGSRHFFVAHAARVTACRELRRGALSDPGDSTRHIELDIGGAPYATADNLYVLPENDAATVDAVARWLGFDLDMWFTLEATDQQAPPPAPPFPVPCSVRDALTHFCDLHGAPRKELVAELAPFAASADERAAMRALAHRDGKARWAETVAGPQRSVVELLQLFPSLRLPLGAFLELAPRLMPRAYTIASSALVHPASVHVCARVVDTPKPGGDASRRLRGVCSTFLARAQPGATMRVYVRPSTFRLPSDVSVPVVLVGPGTLAVVHVGVQSCRHHFFSFRRRHRHCAHARIPPGTEPAARPGRSSRRNRPILRLPVSAALSPLASLANPGVPRRLQAPRA